MTAAVALLTMLALAGAGAIVYLIEKGRVDDANQATIEQEFAEFATLQDNGLDAETQQPFASVEALITAYMRRNVPSENELLVGWWLDQPQVQLPAWDQVTKNPDFVSAVRPLVANNGSTTLDSEFGTLLIDVQGVQQGTERGAFVVVTFQDDTYAGLHDTMRTFATVSALALLLVTGFAAWQSGRLLAPLRTLRETADEITDTDLSRRLPVTGNDDITALTRTVNGMLDRLDEAFTGQRQFLDDAGHELKTPLTVLRGHLELLDVGSPEEIAETRDLLLDEVDRMARLVGDLILLAKSDRPDFISRRPVDLTGLTVDVLAKARALGERRWSLDGTASVTAEVDEQRLTQALLQLCDNAVKHTDAGDEIALGSSYDGNSAKLWVRDSGPGVPPGDRDQIFDRFGRSRVPEHDEGFGLGLSIVRAIALAHEGTVTVTDAQPHGAVFTLVIPIGSAEEQDEPDEIDEIDEIDEAEDTTTLASRVEDKTEELPIWHGS
ncbi:HAMP domain-containing sensor histidine kinase [Nocardioides sp.]|uniref:sensor histidine kinase n=1 Tax=Nocardioides sp. TaxID=35761 RepID=UPI0025CD0EFA|nr:HAMP domain-containing sensor histidine kinase [Nocardioides sp.]